MKFTASGTLVRWGGQSGTSGDWESARFSIEARRLPGRSPGHAEEAGRGDHEHRDKSHICAKLRQGALGEARFCKGGAESRDHRPGIQERPPGGLQEETKHALSKGLKEDRQ